MELNVNKYRIALSTVENYLNHSPHIDLNETISNLAVSTGVPVVAIGYMIAEVKGMTPVLQETINRLTAFYKYDTVIMLEKV